MKPKLEEGIVSTNYRMQVSQLPRGIYFSSNSSGESLDEQADSV